MTSKFDTRIEEQLARAGRSLQELEDSDPLYDVNAMNALATKMNFVLTVLEAVLDERDSLVECLKKSDRVCEVCKYRRIDAWFAADFPCEMCDRRSRSRFEYEAFRPLPGRGCGEESQPVAKGCEEE